MFEYLLVIIHYIIKHLNHVYIFTTFNMFSQMLICLRNTRRNDIPVVYGKIVGCLYDNTIVLLLVNMKLYD